MRWFSQVLEYMNKRGKCWKEIVKEKCKQNDKMEEFSSTNTYRIRMTLEEDNIPGNSERYKY